MLNRFDTIFETFQPTLPGFSQSVSESDVRLWLETIPKIDPDGPRAAQYIRCWNVADKIARAKERGEWPPVAAYTGP